MESLNLSYSVKTSRSSVNYLHYQEQVPIGRTNQRRELYKDLSILRGCIPIELHSGNNTDATRLQNEKTWGCLAYVLKPKLQYGKKLPKWDTRRRRGQYLEKLTSCISTVGIIKNLNTGYVSLMIILAQTRKFLQGAYQK